MGEYDERCVFRRFGQFTVRTPLAVCRTVHNQVQCIVARRVLALTERTKTSQKWFEYEQPHGQQQRRGVVPKKVRRSAQAHNQLKTLFRNRQAGLWRDNLVAGSAAGVADALLLHPFDTLKVRTQLGGSLASEGRALLREGPWALYKGIAPVVTTITPKVAFRFTAYHQLMSLAPRKTFLASLAAGMGAGAVEALVVCPSEIVKIRQQDRSAVPRTQWATFKLLLQEGGVAALYRGALVTTIRQSVQQGCKFAIFEQIRSALGPDSGVPSAVVDLAGGAVANTVGAVINTPVDVVKSRMQRQVGQERKYHGMWQSAVLIVREEGWRALGKGLVPRLFRIAPAGAIQFAVYGYVSSLLHDAKQ